MTVHNNHMGTIYTKRHEKIVCGECKKTFWNTTSSDRIFCDECTKHQCSVCKIVISKNYRCSICHIRHGELSADGHRCQDCFIHNRIKYRKPIII